MNQLIKKLQRTIINFSTHHHKLVMIAGGIITLIFLAAFPNLKTDTDPVHMLPLDNPAVILHNQIKSEFKVSDIIALGIKSKDGSTLFTKEGLTKIKLITDEILKIKDTKNPNEDIFNKVDLLSISTIDDIVKNSAGELLVEKLMPHIPKNNAEAKSILTRLGNNPILGGKVSSNDGSLFAIFIPLNEGKKDRSYFLGEEIKKIAQKYLSKNEEYYFAGLPIAESTFGNEMFVQMGIYAPMAGLVIFILLLLFFRSVKVVIAPMILSMMAVIWSMGALIYSGNVIHIMSSMIPIFIMPIAVLDSVHILSVLSERLGKGEDKTKAIENVVSELFNPMFYTSLTTMIGFASLFSTGIPPVMVFGITIAFGVAMSFLLTIIFIPAYTMFLSEVTIKKFGMSANRTSPIDKIVSFFKNASWKNPKTIIAVTTIIFAISIIGVQKIIINDNPVRWFKKDHPLRTADIQMNKDLAGTYMSNLHFSFPVSEVQEDDIDDFSETEKRDSASIRNPLVISYIDKIGNFLNGMKDSQGNILIGGVTSITDVLKKIGQVAFNDRNLPKTREKISQYMFLYESGDLKKGRDMWKLITNGDSKASQMWVHFKSGDNQNMIYTAKKLDEFMVQNPPPIITNSKGKEEQLKVRWSGLMHINKVWQASMVKGMRDALMGSFVIVFIMMIFLFKSIKWSFIAMLPLTLTISFIYGLIGFTGKFYDMPIAVLSSLTLGLSIDFAIHFIEHTKMYNKELNDFTLTFNKIFNGTAQAIWRNIMVISIGFTPLFFAGLMPYKTVGTFFFLIMLVSGVSTLLLLPAIIKVLHPYLPGLRNQTKETL